MKQTGIFALSVVLLAALTVACDNQKTAQEKLREEKKAIERYMEREGIIVLNDYPKDSIFHNEKEYYKTNEGLYMHVVDRGNLNRRVVPLKDEVQVRFEYMYYIKTFVSGDTTHLDLTSYFPFSFVYGSTGSYQRNPVDLACNGWAIPLAYVGEGAVVNLIIPSALGSSTDNTYFDAAFYKNLKYTHFY